MDVAADPVLGRRFGSYVVEQKLGEGGMGAVYRAVQPEIGKQVAIKFLAPSLSQHPEVVQRFFAEAKAVNLIQHDNIVDIFDFGQSEGQSWFVMELLRGSSLEAALVDKGRFEIGRAVDVAIQVADAIAAAHARDIVHRDLKPDNIFLVTKSGRRDFVKLLDFGIAKLTGGSSAGVSRTMAGAVLGTPGYMSPEQGTGDTVDGRTDLYALGVILFRMLAGQLPFAGESFAQILQKQLTEPPQQLRALRPEVPIALQQLTHQLIARDAKDRPATMAEVLARLIEQLPADYGREPSGPFRVLSPERPSAPSSGEIPIFPGSPTTLSGAAGQRDSDERLDVIARHGDPRKLWIGGAALLVVAVIGGVALGPFGKHGKQPDPTPAPPSPPAVVLNHATPIAAPAPPTPPAATAATPAPAPASGFGVYLETAPPGAEIWQGERKLGETPLKVSLPGAQAELRLRLGGFRDEPLEVTAHTEHALVRLRPLPPAPPRPVAARPARPPAAAQPVRLPAPPPTPPARPKKPAIGLDD